MRLRYVAHSVRSLTVVIVLLVGSPWIGVTPASASCALPRALPTAISSAASVFVGTVTAATWGGRRATVSVEDVWRGPVKSPAVVVGTPGDERSISSVDRKYVVGTTYLFVPYAVRKGEWQDNSCSNTQVYAAALARFRPAGATRIETVPSPSPSLSPSAEPSAAESRPSPIEDSRDWWWVLAGLPLAVVPVALLLRRRRFTRSGPL